MAKRHSQYEIESFDDSWEVNPTDGLPQSGKQVREFLGSKYDETSQRLSTIEEIIAMGELEFKFINTPSGQIVVNGSEPYNFPFQIRSMLVHDDGTEEEYDRNVYLTIDVTINGNITTSAIGNVATNRDLTVNITPYVSDGATFVLRATNPEGKTARSAFYDVTKASIGLEARGNTWWASPFVLNQSWHIPLSINLNVNAVLMVTVKDAQGVTRSSKTVPSSQLSTNYDLTFPHPYLNGGASGVYSVKIELTATDEYLSGLAATPLEYNICCLTTTDTNNYMLVNNVGSGFKNYSTNRMFEYSVIVGYGNPTLDIKAYDGAEKVADTGDMYVESGVVVPYNLSLELERSDDSDFDIDVVASIDGTSTFEETFTFSNKEGYAATAGAAVLLKFNGRSNTQSNRETFYNAITGEAITPEIAGVGWSEADGYHNETLRDGTVRTAFRLLAGSHMVLPLTPLSMGSYEGRTIEFLYKLSNIRDFDSNAISCLSQAGNGFYINGNEIALFTPSATLHDDQNVGVDYTEYMHVAIVVRPQPNGSVETVDNFSACQIYINGCRQRWFSFDRDLNVNSPITIGSDYCDIDLYAVRIYEKVLSESEIEQNTCNWMATEDDKMEYKNRNAVRENGTVSFNRVKASCNVIVFECNELPSRMWSSSQSTAAVIEIHMLNEDVQVFNVTDLKWQGTTSHNYGTNAEYGGLGQNYKWTAGGTKMCAKANWASSMQSHKIGLTAAYTDIAKAIGLIPDTQRISIYQKPMAGFQRKLDGTMSFVGLFTVGPDKGDKSTFNWTGNSLFMEGSDNEPLGTNFIIPWNDDTVSVDSENEKYYLNEVKSWEDASKKPAYIESVWKPAYNFVYGCMQRIRPYNGTPQSMGSAELDTSYSYWLSPSGATMYDMYYYNSALEWTPSGINLSDQLVDQGYGLTSEDLADKTDNEKNELFKEARKVKFKLEVGQYFSVDFAKYHIAFIEFFACSDNLSKNTYPFVLDCTGENKLICWRQDDLDSSMQTENQGKNYKKYCVEITDNYASYGRDNLMIFNGTDNQFWLLIRECFADEIDAYMRSTFIPALGYGQSADPLTMFDSWCKHYIFDNVQNHFPEALYNETGRLRYGYGHMSVGYQYRGIALSQDSGNCYYAEKQWLRLRFIYMSSKYTCGNFAAGSTTDVFTTRPYSDPVGNTFEITPAIYMYPSVQNGQTVIRGIRIYPGNEQTSWEVTLPPTEGDQEQRINGMSYISSLGPLYNAAIHGNVDVNGKMLTSLEIGTRDGIEDIRSEITGLGIGDATSLQELVLSNIETLVGVVNLSSCVNLKELYADGTGITSIVLSEGGPLNTIYLPQTLRNLTLIDKKDLEELSLESSESLVTIDVEGCPEDITIDILDMITDMEDFGALESVTLEFGSSAAPMAVTTEQIDTIVALINSEDITSAFSGHIELESGSISMLTMYLLGLNGITYHGATTHVQYELSANPSTIIEGGSSELTIVSEDDIPIQSLVLSIGSITVISGTITEEEVEALCSIEGNILHVANSEMEERWKATIVLNHYLSFDPSATHQYSVEAKGTVHANNFNVSGDTDITIVNSQPVTKNYAIAWLPVGCDTPSALPQVTCDSPNVSIFNIHANGFSVTYNGSVSYDTEITVVAVGVTKTVQVEVTHKKVPNISIVGPDYFAAPDGTGSQSYQFGYNPSDYDVEVSLVSVEASNEIFEISNTSLAGFGISVAGINVNQSTTITATFSVDGNTVTLTKNITARYEDSRPHFGLYNAGDSASDISVWWGGSNNTTFFYAVASDWTPEQVDTYDYSSLQYSQLTRVATSNVLVASLAAGSVVFCRIGQNYTWHKDSATADPLLEDIFQFVIPSGDIQAYGNFARFFKDGYLGSKTVDSYYGCCCLFQSCTGLTAFHAAMDVEIHSQANWYSYMFNECSSLTTAPELPATTLAEYCYASMFNECTSLTTAPELPATTLAEHCYWAMFRQTALTTAPELPATTLAEYCYYGMFNECSSLTTAPELPATTLAEHCYASMFSGCTSLVTGPAILATVQADKCFYCMFQGCTNLKWVKMMLISMSNYPTEGWMVGVGTGGVFVKNRQATWTDTGRNGVPYGWTVQYADE